MLAVVRNGCCEIQAPNGRKVLPLPPSNIDEAVMRGDYVAVVLRNGYSQLYKTTGQLVCTYSVHDAKFVKFHNDAQLAIHRRNGMTEIRDFHGRLIRVKS